MGISATASPGPGVNSLIFCQRELTNSHDINDCNFFYILTFLEFQGLIFLPFSSETF